MYVCIVLSIVCSQESLSNQATDLDYVEMIDKESRVLFYPCKIVVDVRDVKYVIKIQSRHHSITSSSVKYVQKYITFYVQTYVHSISNLINGANLSVKVQRAYKIFKKIEGTTNISFQNPVFDLEKNGQKVIF